MLTTGNFTVLDVQSCVVVGSSAVVMFDERLAVSRVSVGVMSAIEELSPEAPSNAPTLTERPGLTTAARWSWSAAVDAGLASW